ncbi:MULTISPECIES: DUF742 domain-containing protein [Actinomadura]|uniref:Multi-component regulatory system-11 n=2 Tax=Actinomadura TaxID=1988 RepID=A0A7D3ZWR5_ACTVE|nr:MULTISPECIES: DUF742 domain-containing protein [Actinomadura]MBO2464824.1 DUF742 domain-containing protein [Actinomadura violacea]QKG20244.1 multi-component regulatory system-11 [Actinomadura verrucosospora]
METPRERWVGADAGPIVRPYAVTRGRTRPRGLAVDLVTLLVATGRTPGERVWLSREQRRLLELCRRPSTPADLASDTDLPLRVVQILLEDLHHYGLVEELPQAGPSGPSSTGRPDPKILMRVLDELRRL